MTLRNPIRRYTRGEPPVASNARPLQEGPKNYLCPSQAITYDMRKGGHLSALWKVWFTRDNILFGDGWRKDLTLQRNFPQPSNSPCVASIHFFKYFLH